MTINEPIGPVSGPPKSSPHFEQVGEQRGPTTIGTTLKVPADSIGRTILPPTNITFAGPERRTYPKEANAPVLEQPLEPEEVPTTSPLNQASQAVVLRYFMQEFVAMMKSEGASQEEINNYLSAMQEEVPTTGTTVTSRAKKMEKKAAAATAKAINLPASWSPTSKKVEDWTLRPMTPYSKEEQGEIEQYYGQQLNDEVEKYIAEAKPPLTDTQVANLRGAVKTGKVSSEIAQPFVEVTRQATIATQDQYRLPVTWMKETTEVTDLTPAYPAALNPQEVAIAGMELTVNNLTDVAEESQLFAEKILSDQPKEKEEVGNYYLALANIMGVIQDSLNAARMTDAKVTDVNANEAASSLQDKMRLSKLYFKDLKKQRAAEAKSRRFGWIMKIVGIVLAVVSLVAALLPPLALVGAIVAALFTTYAAFDAAFDLTSQAFEGLSELISKMMPNGSEAAQTGVKLAVVAALLIILAATGVGAMKAVGGAATTATTQATATAARESVVQITRESVKQAIKMGTIQLGMLVFAGSGALPETVSMICKAIGLNEEQIMIVQIIVTALVLIATVAAAAYASKAAPQTAAAAVPDERSITQMITDSIRQFPRDTAQFFRDIANITSVDKIMIFKQFVQILPSLTNIINSSYQGAMMLEISNVLKGLGELKAAQDMLDAMIDHYQGMVKIFQSSISDLSTVSADVQATFNNIIDSQNRAVTNLIRSSSRG